MGRSGAMPVLYILGRRWLNFLQSFKFSSSAVTIILTSSLNVVFGFWPDGNDGDIGHSSDASGAPFQTKRKIACSKEQCQKLGGVQNCFRQPLRAINPKAIRPITTRPLN